MGSWEQCAPLPRLSEQCGTSTGRYVTGLRAHSPAWWCPGPHNVGVHHRSSRPLTCLVVPWPSCCRSSPVFAPTHHLPGGVLVLMLAFITGLRVHSPAWWCPGPHVFVHHRSSRPLTSLVAPWPSRWRSSPVFAPTHLPGGALPPHACPVVCCPSALVC